MLRGGTGSAPASLAVVGRLGRCGLVDGPFLGGDRLTSPSETEPRGPRLRAGSRIGPLRRERLVRGAVICRRDDVLAPIDGGRALAWTGRVKRVTEHEADPEGEHADVVRQVVHLSLIH